MADKPGGYYRGRYVKDVAAARQADIERGLEKDLPKTTKGEGGRPRR